MSASGRSQEADEADAPKLVLSTRQDAAGTIGDLLAISRVLHVTVHRPTAAAEAIAQGKLEQGVVAELADLAIAVDRRDRRVDKVGVLTCAFTRNGTLDADIRASSSRCELRRVQGAIQFVVPDQQRADQVK